MDTLYAIEALLWGYITSPLVWVISAISLGFDLIVIVVYHATRPKEDT